MRWPYLISIAIVLGPFSATSQSIRISEKPAVTIGGDADTLTQFTRIAGATRTANGQIVVASGTDVRVFSPTGKFVRSLARNGAGPNEVRTITWFGRSGDSVLIYDAMQRRLLIFDMSARPHEAVTIPFQVTAAPGTQWVVTGHLADGSWLLRTIHPPPRDHADGPFVDSIQVGLWRPEGGAAPRILGEYGGLAWFALHIPGGPPTPSYALDSLARPVAFATTTSDLWIGDPARGTVTVRSAGSPTATNVPLQEYRGAYDARSVARVAAVTIATTPQGKQPILKAMFDPATRSRELPVFERFVPGVAGELWVELFRVDKSVQAEFLVIDRSGKLKGRVGAPADVRFLEFGRDYALGVHRDSDDVETLAVYRLVRLAK